MVEKRNHPLISLFLNQLLYAVVSFVIVTTMSGKLQFFFGLFFLFLYLSGVYSYAHRAGTDHQKSYSQIRPHIKYPLAYALIAMGYVLLPLGIHWILQNQYVFLAVIFWESPFYFGHILYNDGVINFAMVGIVSALIAVVTGFGYLCGVKQFYIIRLVHNLLYRPVEKDTEKQ